MSARLARGGGVGAAAAPATLPSQPRGTARLVHYMTQWGEVFAQYLFHAYVRKHKPYRLFLISQPADYNGK